MRNAVRLLVFGGVAVVLSGCLGRPDAPLKPPAALDGEVPEHAIMPYSKAPTAEEVTNFELIPENQTITATAQQPAKPEQEPPPPASAPEPTESVESASALPTPTTTEPALSKVPAP